MRLHQQQPHDTCEIRMYDHLFQQQGLSLERLNALVGLAEYGSLIQAAKGDSGKQSRLSHHLKELSSYFGVEMTERFGKSIRLTEAGTELAQLARQHLDALAEFQRHIQGKPPHFRIGAGDSLLQWLFIPALGKLRMPGSNPTFELLNLRTQEINTQLQDQRIDFGLLREEAVAKGLRSTRIHSVRYVVIVPDRIWTRRGMLTLNDALLKCPHATLSSDDSMRISIDQIASSLGGKFDPMLRCESLSQCVAAVKTGAFAAVLPEWAWDHSTQIKHSICDDPRLDAMERSLVLAWHPRLMETRERPAKALMESLIRVLGDQ